MGMEAHQTRFFWSTSTAQSSAQQVGEVVDFSGPGGAAAVIDITHLGSTAKEKLPGIPDEGQLSLSLNYNATDVGHLALIADRGTRTKRKGLLKFNDAVTHCAVFDAFCIQYTPQGAVDNKIAANAVIEITGGVTYTTA